MIEPIKDASNKVFAQRWQHYELIDAGGGKKLERWGDVITIRPERQAYFQSGLPFSEWNEIAHWEFVEKDKHQGKWKKLQADAPDNWSINFEKLQFELKIGNNKHVGLFPEQVENWNFLKQVLQPSHQVLNLFAYTGAASLVAKSLGASVTHVDAVKSVLQWAKNNMSQSQLSDIRWIQEDALKFAEKEQKRGQQYDCIIMDPPAWGVGTKKEKWILEDKLPELLKVSSHLLTNNGTLILNTYSPTIDIKIIQKLAKQFFSDRKISTQELWMKSYSNKEMYFGNLLRISK